MRSTPSLATMRRTVNISSRAVAPAGDDGALEVLEALLAAFDDADGHDDGVADLEVEWRGAVVFLIDDVK